MNPLVSVVIPARNSETTLSKSLKSVLEQSYENIEILVVVNGSYDNTFKVANSTNDKRVKVVESSPGIVPALNTGLKLSKGKYIARQDADDEWMPGKLQKQVDFLENNNVDVLGTQMHVKSVNAEHFTNYPLLDHECRNWLFDAHNPIGHPSVVFKSSLVEKVGGYWEIFPLAEDFDLGMRMFVHAKFANLSEIFVTYNHVPNPNYNPLVPNLVSNFYKQIYRRI
jgi:glycosyltransferase involved in cell wall biosynthesis